MQPFLDKIIEACFPVDGNDFSKTCIIFPTRRAGLIFKNKLMQKMQRAIWMPAVFSINDFLVSVSPYRIAERTQLMLELFIIYKKYFPKVNYDVYAAWGEMMLKDFDEADKHLVDIDKLFKNIQSVKEIDETFQFGEEEMSELKLFWQNFSDKDLSDAKTGFINTWKILKPVYTAYTSALLQKGIAYEGLVYRELAASPDKYFQSLSYSQFIIAGFYALSPAEENIFSYLHHSLQAKLFWDADAYYTDNKIREAGNFFRKNSFTQQSFQWKSDCFSTEKNIEITGVSMQSGQAKILGQLLKEKLASGFVEEETAIVLPDETMLDPVLNSLPDSIQHLNITMGLPVRKTKIFSLIMLWHKLAETHSAKGEKLFLHTQTLLEVCRHPFIAGTIHPETIRQLKKSTNNYIFFKSLPYHESRILQLLVKFPESFDDVFRCVENVLTEIKELPSATPNKYSVVDLEIVNSVVSEFKSLGKLLEPYKQLTTVHEAWMVIKDFFNALKIPFSGEPVKGIQLMGFLETRVLDFKNVFILNLNENNLPPNNLRNSFIPYTIRRSFGLPTVEDNDAISAYHFYRLLQRSQNVFLLYNTETKSVSGGEMSRYLLQLFFELKNSMQEKLILKHNVASGPAKAANQGAIEIQASDELKGRLRKLFAVNVEGKAEVSFTPSAINTYINCSLQFYYRYVARIKEPDSIEEEIEDGKFGEILHKAMENLYAGYKGKEVTAILLKSIDESAIKNIVQTAIREKYDADFISSGKNFLVEKTLIALVRKIIAEDLSNAPFTYLDSEKKYSSPYEIEENFTVLFAGVFDRIDRHNTTMRIVDYKTGKAELKNFKTVEDIFSDTAYKINLQLLFYVWLASKKLLQEKITAAVYPLKNMSGGALYLSTNELTDAVYESFEKELKNLAGSIILNPYFSQTTDLKKCSVCPYKIICNR